MQGAHSKDFHPDDPRRLTREALSAGDLASAQVWAELSTAEAIHRLAKTVGRAFETPDSNRDAAIPLERGRHRRPADQPAESEQAA